MASYLMVCLYNFISGLLSSDTTPSSSSPRKMIRIGSRKSKLALVQTDIVRDALKAAHPDLEFEVIAMATMGDNNQTTPLYSFGAKALWTQELEVLLLEGKLDMIVHSLKDMPTQLPSGCKIGAILKREDPRDALVMKAGSTYTSLSDLPAGSVVGTSSVRRIAQVARKYPHLQFLDVRGNVGTRLSKLDDPESAFACLILAAAGLVRLDLGDRITEYLSSPTLLHAVGQGALGVETCEGDEEIQALLAPLAHRETTLHCLAERSLMRTLGGCCSVPIGVETEVSAGGALAMKAIVASIDGTAAVNVAVEMKVGSEKDAEEFGKTVAHKLTEMGAGDILNAIQATKRSMDSS